MSCHYDFIIVGAGITGCTLAERLAEGLDKRVLVVEKRPYIGGNCHDYMDSNGIFIHAHGPHIFHTNRKKVWDYLSDFTNWINYVHKVLVSLDGQFYPFPINIDTINQLYGTSHTEETIEGFYKSQRIKIDTPRNAEEVITSQVGEDLYNTFFLNYTKKQWGLSPKELLPKVTQRIPIRTNRDNRYFTDIYQGIPENGYTQMMEKMLDSERISIDLNTDYHAIKSQIHDIPTIYTGPIDEYYDYKIGRLTYRSLRFEFKTLDIEYFQPTAVVNYPNEEDFIRITEYKHFTSKECLKTVISREFSKSSGDPYYPVPSSTNSKLYQEYVQLQDHESIRFAGRLGTYKYLNIDDAVFEALALYETIASTLHRGLH